MTSNEKGNYDYWTNHIHSLGPVFSRLSPALLSVSEKERIFVFEDYKGKLKNVKFSK